MLRSTLQRAWLQRGPLACLLWPASQLFRLLAAIRLALFRGGLMRRGSAGVPVIVVGNVVAGGAGKTPVVMALLQHLQARGLGAGVVSRGYGRRTAGCREVTGASTAAEVGDEPLLIARQCRVPVVVAASRADAAHALRAAHPDVQVIVSDDGLQHHALQRDIEVCVFDERGIGNGWLLPAGPLREAWPRPVDLVLRPALLNGVEGFTLVRRLADHAVRADGARIDLAGLHGRPCRAVAGIAHPDAFFAMLRDKGLLLQEAVALPDHYDFDSMVMATDGDYSLICTEKDAVKLWRRQPGAWAVPLVLEIEAGFWKRLDQLLDAKLSSVHGSETA